MNIKKYIGLLILLLMLVVSSCQKQDIVTDTELFEGVEVSNRMYSTTSLNHDDEYINDDEDEDEDPDGDEDEDCRSSLIDNNSKK